MRRTSVVIAVLAFIVTTGSLTGAASGRSGTIDPGFGELDGRVIAGAPAQTVNTLPFGLVSLGDGSTISSEFFGRDSRSALVKRGPDGSPDPSFGEDGTALLPLYRGRHFSAYHLALQGDSVIAVSGASGGHRSVLTVQRFDIDTGERDTSFGDGGVTRFALSDFAEGGGSLFYAFGLGIDESGRIYVGASKSFWDSPDLLIRLTGDGEIDQSFGDSGAVTVSRGNCFPFDHLAVTDQGVFVYSHDCIKSYGETGNLKFTYDKQSDAPLDRNIDSVLGSPGGTTYVSISSGDDPDTIRILKLNADGTVEPAFGAGGLIPTFPGQPELLLGSLSIDSEGRFLLSGKPEVGTYEDPLEDHSQEVVRLTAEGEPDGSFGVDGMVVFDPPVQNLGEFPAITVVPDGMVLLGSRGSYGFPYLSRTAVKVRNDGTRDESYGDGGLLRFRASVPADDQIFDTLALTGGGTLTAGKVEHQPAFIQFLPDGRPDTSFGEDGRLTLPATGYGIRDGARDIAELETGDFVACINSGKSVNVAMISRSGSLVPGFGQGGTVTLPDFAECGGIAATKDGILVIGSNTNHGFVMTHLFDDGTRDQAYGDGGRVMGPPGGFGRPQFAFTVLPGGRTLIANRGELMKLSPGGDPIRDFGDDGTIQLPLSFGGIALRSAGAVVSGTGGAIYIAGHNKRSPFLDQADQKG